MKSSIRIPKLTRFLAYNATSILHQKLTKLDDEKIRLNHG